MGPERAFSDRASGGAREERRPRRRSRSRRERDGRGAGAVSDPAAARRRPRRRADGGCRDGGPARRREAPGRAWRAPCPDVSTAGTTRTTRTTRAGSAAVRVVGEGGPAPSSPTRGGEGHRLASRRRRGGRHRGDRRVGRRARRGELGARVRSAPLPSGGRGGGVRRRRRARWASRVRVQRVRRAARAPPRARARRLLVAAHASAARGGVEYVYCHVERANVAARGLYESLGYVAEAEESDWLAGKLGRPPRVLMRKSLERDATFLRKNVAS